MNESPESESLSPLAQLFTPAESEALAELMLSFDGGMLDFGELDGFLSALAVAPQPQSIERWWTALVGPEPEWEAEDEPARARALIERYYGMVQARVAMSPFDLGPESMPPLWSMTDEEEGDYDEEEIDYGDDEFDVDDSDLDDDIDVDDADDDEGLADIETVRAQLRAAIEAEPDLDQAVESDDADFDDDEFDDEAFDDLAEEDPEFLADDMDFSFAVGETWLSGFRYALSLQADEWRKVIEAEPPLARWLDAMINLCGLLVSAILVYYGVLATWDSYRLGSLIFKELIFPEWWLLWIMPLSGLLLGLEFIRRSWQLFTRPGNAAPSGNYLPEN